jgi:DNA-binding Lrp family transcriptional regulator
MAKNSAKQIIEDEKEILKQLSKNANKSINEIAKDCGFSRQKVWRVIKNLEKNKTIWGYTTVINEEKQSMKGYILLIKRSNKPIDKELLNRIVKREVLKKTAKIGVEITNSAYTNGVYDWIICFIAPDIKNAKKFAELTQQVMEGFVSEVQLVEELFVVQRCGVQNPELNKIRDFFDLE